MTPEKILEELEGRDVVLFVADEGEISPSLIPFPVVFTGIGKMRMFASLLEWYNSLGKGRNPVVLNIGSAGSAKYPIGTLVGCSKFINGGSELIYDSIETPGEGSSVFTGDYFMSTQTFSPEQVKDLSSRYYLFDMEAYAAAHFCRMHGLPFYCIKAVSDNLDGSLKDWRPILEHIRAKFSDLLSGD